MPIQDLQEIDKALDDDKFQYLPNISKIFQKNLIDFLDADNRDRDSRDYFRTTIKKLLIPKDAYQEDEKILARERFKLFDEIDIDCVSFFNKKSKNPTEFKQQFCAILKKYTEYFSKINDFPLEDQALAEKNKKVLQVFVEGGILYQRIQDLNQDDLERFSSVALSMIFLFNKLIYKFEDARVKRLDKSITEQDEQSTFELAKFKEKIFDSLNQFTNPESFSKIDNILYKVDEANKNLEFDSIHEKVFDKIFQESKTKVTAIKKDNIGHHASLLFLFLIGIEQIGTKRKLSRIEESYSDPDPKIKLRESFEILQKFKSENFFYELTREYEDFYKNYRPYPGFLEEFNINLAPSSRLKHQALKDFELVFSNLQSKFNIQELRELELSKNFFIDEESKLLTPQKFQEKLTRVIGEKLSPLYPQYYSANQIYFFKHLLNPVDLFCDTQSDCLDRKKMPNLLNLFEAIKETDSADEKQQKLEKTASGLFILRQMSYNTSGLEIKIDHERIYEPLFYFDFFEEFQKQQKMSFTEFFKDSQGLIREEYRGSELEPMIKFLLSRQPKINKFINEIKPSSNPENKKLLALKKAVDEYDLSEYLGLEENVNIIFETKHLTTLIHHFCENGNLESVESLIKRGANIDAKKNNGENALHIACRNGNKEIVKILLKKMEENFNIDYIDMINKLKKNLADNLSPDISNLLADFNKKFSVSADQPQLRRASIQDASSAKNLSPNALSTKASAESLAPINLSEQTPNSARRRSGRVTYR